MVKSLKGWLKIYLFYGVVFFLLGLFGSLASDQVRLQAWSNRQKEKLVGVWSQIVQSGNDEPIVPAFTNHSGKVILQVYEPDNQQTVTPFKSLIQELQRQLKTHFQQVLIMPVENFNTNSWESNSSDFPILIGFKKTHEISQKGVIIRNRFFFGMPEPDSALLAGKLTEVLAHRLTSFYLRKGTDVQNTIYELEWDEKNSDDDRNHQESETFSAFMQIMNQDIIPAMGRPNLK